MANSVRGGEQPIAVEVKAGEAYFWCTCGRSSTQPFCDGSHKDTGLSPMRYEPDEDKKLFFCTCKSTANAPLCDGSHNK